MTTAKPASTHDTSRLRLGSVELKPLHNQVYERVRDAIMAGRFLPGQTLSMQAIAEALGTSTMPVREALRRLASEGAVEIRPKRAVRIPYANRGPLREVGELRIAIEGLAADKAAGRIEAHEIDQLEGINRAADEALAANRLHDYLALNQQFHFALYQAARMEIGLGIIEGLWLRMGPVQGLYTPEAVEIGATQHREIIEALRAGDPAAARLALADDIRIGLDLLLERVPPGENG